MTVGTGQVIGADRLRSLARTVLGAVGMPDQDAELTADAMVWADLRGLDAHGVTAKLPQCVRRIRAGGTAAAARLRVVSETSAAAWIDAGNAWGQVAAARAMNAAIDRVNSKMSALEKIRRIALTPEGFTIDNAMLTPSLKIRRHVIRERYGEVLKKLYERS